MPNQSYYAVGLTGGIGCGKSAVAAVLSAAGATVVDADMLAHRVTAAGGEAIEPIRSRFGTGFIAASGALDRAAMRRHVFADPACRQALESIVHPLVRQAAEEEALACQRAGAPYVVFAIPLLVESGEWTQRVMKRSGLSAAEVLAIIGQQASRAARLVAANDVLVNAGPLTQLAPRAARLHGQYLRLAKGHAAATAGAL